jgi:hypothetical protein
VLWTSRLARALSNNVPPLVSARTVSAFEIEGIPRFWVKYGVSITLGEAEALTGPGGPDRERRTRERCARPRGLLRLLTPAVSIQSRAAS